MSLCSLGQRISSLEVSIFIHAWHVFNRLHQVLLHLDLWKHAGVRARVSVPARHVCLLLVILRHLGYRNQIWPTMRTEDALPRSRVIGSVNHNRPVRLFMHDRARAELVGDQVVFVHQWVAL